MAVEALGWTALILSVFALGAGAAAWFNGSRARVCGHLSLFRLPLKLMMTFEATL